MSDRRFDAREAHKLDEAARLARQPPGPLVELAARGAPTVILDIGAGTGTYALPLLERLPGARILALDLQPRMLEKLCEKAAERHLAGRIVSVLASADGPARWPIEDGFVDLALMINLYHELDDRPAVLSEIRRVLAPEGVLLICDWRPEGNPDAGPPREHRIPLQVVRSELEASGFSRLSIHDLYPDFYVLMAHP